MKSGASVLNGSALDRLFSLKFILVIISSELQHSLDMGKAPTSPPAKLGKPGRWRMPCLARVHSSDSGTKKLPELLLCHVSAVWLWQSIQLTLNLSGNRDPSFVGCLCALKKTEHTR